PPAGDARGRGSAGAQPRAQRAWTAAEVEDERVRPAGAGLDGVDQRGEPFLAVREVHLLLAVPAGDPVPCGGGVEFRQFRHAMLLVTGYACFVSYNPRRMTSNWSSELQQSHGYGCPDGGRAGEPADAGRGPQPGVR